MPPLLADAALLAAQAPEGGVLPPGDESVGAAYLDLRGDRLDVAASKLRAVALAFGPSLYVQERLRLVVASGVIGVVEAAAAFSSALPPSTERGAPLIGVVRGEDLLGRLEELMAAGCDFSRQEDGAPLGADPRAPVGAWAPAPAAPIAGALAAGAVLVVSRRTSPEQAAAAVAADANATTAALTGGTEPAPVELEFASRYRFEARLPRGVDCETLTAGWPAPLREACTLTLEPATHHTWMNLEASGIDAAVQAARRVELAAPAGSIQRPCTDGIEPIIEPWPTTVPAGLLEFGADVRPAADWI